MDWLKPYLITRVRVAALRAQALAGGEVRPGQLRRAIEPILGDLLPLPADPAADAADQATAREELVTLLVEESRRQALGGPPIGGRPADAVFSGEEDCPW